MPRIALFLLQNITYTTKISVKACQHKIDHRRRMVATN